jgi:FkbM family methyltransferase
MKKIFIDGGARIGESIEVLLEKREDLKGCDVYLFECNPSHIPTLEEIKNTKKEFNFIVKNEALWVEDIEKDFFISIDQWGDLGCTLLSNKRERLDLENPLRVKCIDITNLLNEFDDNDYVVLKLDIEGAEYEVLRHMLNNNSIEKINELYVEFHDHFFNENSHQLKNELLQKNIKCDFNWM